MKFLPLAALALAGCAGGPAPASPALLKGADWLLANQHPDGSWHGHLEGTGLRPGPAMTAFSLYALSGMPDAWRAAHVRPIRAAIHYLETQLNRDGIVGWSGDGPDFPNYSTSFTILSFDALKPEGYRAKIARMADSLKRAQLDEDEGWTPEDSEYGGWGLGGPPQPKPYSYRLDLSVTRFALEALATAGVSADDPVWSKARRFVEGCQNEDGGFFFTPLKSPMNKTGDFERDGKRVRPSYGTTTADGLASLQFASSTSARIDSARAWLGSRFSTERVPGFAPDHNPPYQDGLLGYWFTVATHRASGRPEWRAPVRARIESSQLPDGSWASAVALMHEDEPVQATALAIVALTR